MSLQQELLVKSMMEQKAKEHAQRLQTDLWVRELKESRKATVSQPQRAFIAQQLALRLLRIGLTLIVLALSLANVANA